MTFHVIEPRRNTQILRAWSFFSCSCGNSGFKHGSVIVNNIFAHFTLSLSTACDLRAPHRLTRPAFEVHNRGSPCHPKQTLHGVTFQRAHPLPATPFQWPRLRTATLGLGAAAPFLPSRPAWLYIEPSPCGGVRPAGDPVDSDLGAVFEDDPHPKLDVGRPLKPWVCHHTREPTVLSRVSCRPFHLNVDRFHQPCLLPGRTSRTGEDCRPRTTWRPLTIFGSLALPVRLTGGFCHADQTVPRQDVNSSFPPCVCHPVYQRVFAHTQVRDPRESAAACLGNALGTPSPWPPQVNMIEERCWFSQINCYV